MNHQEKDDPVWDLLNHASKVEPGPFFSRNTVREVRLQSAKPTWSERLGDLLIARSARFALSATAVIAVGIAFYLSNSTAPTVPTELAEQSVEESFDPASELEEVEYLGQLMAVADPGTLTDDVLADLFF